MLPGGIIQSLTVTIHTVKKQLLCKKHDWQIDEFGEVDRQGRGWITEHCTKCGKRRRMP